MAYLYEAFRKVPLTDISRATEETASRTLYDTKTAAKSQEEVGRRVEASVAPARPLTGVPAPLAEVSDEYADSLASAIEKWLAQGEGLPATPPASPQQPLRPPETLGFGPRLEASQAFFDLEHGRSIDTNPAAAGGGPQEGGHLPAGEADAGAAPGVHPGAEGTG